MISVFDISGAECFYANVVSRQLISKNPTISGFEFRGAITSKIGPPE